MKALTIVCVTLGLMAGATQAFAGPMEPAPGAAQAPVAGVVAPDTQVSMMADAGVSQPETRGQVHRELIQAQHDGELKRLDSTIYAHH